MFRVSAVALLASTFLASPAFAADAGTGGNVELAEADPIVVIGERIRYDAEN